MGPLTRQGGAAGAQVLVVLDAPYDRTRALLPVGGTLPVARRPLVGGRGDYTVPRVYAWLSPQGVHGGGRRYALPSAPCSLCVEEWPLPDSWCLGHLNSGRGRRKGLMHTRWPHTPPRVWVGARPLPVAWWVPTVAGGARAAYTRHLGFFLVAGPTGEQPQALSGAARSVCVSVRET